MINPYYADFRKQSWLQKLATKEKWTICDNEKVPIDVFGVKYLNQIFGAKMDRPYALDTLDELYDAIPDLSNFDFYLQAPMDNIVVLDIEPSCPERIKQNLLQWPAIYCERSMSGKGIHMVFPYPDDLAIEIPNIASKVVLKPDHKYYEILLNHFVTFTGDVIPHTPTKTMEPFRKLFRSLGLKKSKKQSGGPLDIQIENIEELKPKDCPVLDDILNYLEHEAGRRDKTPADYHDDMSTYEYCHMLYLNRRLNSILKISYINDVIKNRPFTINERSWCVYQIGAKTLPGRKKHTTTRNCGSIRVPWLMYVAMNAIRYDIDHPEEEDIETHEHE